MNKSQIRKKILGIRKKNNNKKLKINFKSLLDIFEIEKIKGKNIGGYYPYNFQFSLQVQYLYHNLLLVDIILIIMKLM